jgi:ABC-type multidrug transport system ATPase subunit
MKQKLLIAMALGRPARLLILDEPAANLDPAGARRPVRAARRTRAMRR